MRLAWLVFLCLYLAALGYAQAPLRLKPNDAVRLTVFGKAEFSGDYVVQSDGAIYAQGVGRLVVRGLTVAQVQEKIRARLERVLINPLVTVLLTTESKRFVYVVGGRQTGADSGLVPFEANLDLRKVLAQAGPPQDTDLLTIAIYRNGRVIQNVDPAKLLNNEAGAWDGPLQPDDVVVINPTPYLRAFILGDVRKPGEVKIRQGQDVYEALAQAGDINLDRNPNTATGDTPRPAIRQDFRITIRRGSETIDVPSVPIPGAPRFELVPGDTVYVQQREQIRVRVLGEVNRPGEEILDAGSTASLAISGAGGINGEGTLRRIYLYRLGEVRMINLLQASGDINPQAGALQSGDVVLVPRNQRVYYVFGQVRSEGRKIMDDRRKIYLADVLSTAGGITPAGVLRRVVLLRPDATGKMVPHLYNLDQYIKDGDQSQNPEIEPEDIVYFNTSKGLSFSSILQAVSAALLINTAARSL